MWLSNSSVGRKVVMSVTGIALILFLTFHMAMNLVALVRAGSYRRSGCLIHHPHHLRFLADDAKPQSAR